jgi:acylphosphatase
MPPKRAHIRISGRVQGVSFRYYTRQQALSKGVGGWVRNLISGDVEAVFEGEEDDVEEMVAWCRQGPPAARVQHVHLDWEVPSGDLDGFDIRSTGSGRDRP